MPATQLPGQAQYFDLQNGVVVPCAGYFVDTYIGGTTTPLVTFSDAAGTIANQNPIILDAEGKARIFLQVGGIYTFRISRPVALGGGNVDVIDDISGIAPPSSGSFLPIEGGSLTGPLVLAGDATQNLGAVTRQQLSLAVANATSGISATLTAANTAVAAANAAVAGVAAEVARQVAALPPPPSGVPPGVIAAWPTVSPPLGWFACEGAALSRATFAPLFAVIGATYGAGDGSTTFNVPDLRGEFVRGWAGARAVDGGRVLGTSQSDTVGPHLHSFVNQFGRGNADGNGSDTDEGVLFRTPIGLAGAYNPVTSENGGTTETRPRNVALMYIIKT